MINLENISPLGNGLNVLINSNYELAHDWMTFASWYSISKNLPDAKVRIHCNRGVCNKQIFNWPNRCKVEFSFNKKPDDCNYFEITPNIMAVSVFNPNLLGPVSCKGDEPYTFVDYAAGCGNFDLNENYCPFSHTSKLFSEDLSLNEYRILKLWDKSNMPYITTA